MLNILTDAQYEELEAQGRLKYMPWESLEKELYKEYKVCGYEWPTDDLSVDILVQGHIDALLQTPEYGMHGSCVYYIF